MIEIRWLKEKDKTVLQYRLKIYTVKKGESIVAGVEVTMSDWITVPFVEAP